MRTYFIKTNRIGFSKWQASDEEYALSLWGDPEVTRYICASGSFSHQEVINRLLTEISNEEQYHIQYWPIFNHITGEFLGCCGLRLYDESSNIYELGFHICKKYWKQGYAMEAANAAINYCFENLNASKIFAGHNPKNVGSKKLLEKLGFSYIRDEYYEPTGLYHPSYELCKPFV
jgi:RimJ/RimL family protein N-acetyltransferase